MIVIESLNHINLPAHDLEKSVEFYAMLLDFEEVESDTNSVTISFDDKLNIRLIKTEGSPINSNFPIFSFIMDIDDFTEALQEIESSNIPIISGPSEIDGGENLLIADPAGNTIELYYQE
ncbi:MAG: VOC family protein [Spirochaetia bacterium]|nr:VOC family protein [Spirochaetia bacterium]